MFPSRLVPTICIATAAALIGLAACGAPAAATSGTRPAAASSPAARTASVRISNFAFRPATVTVRAGGTVTWTQEDTDLHTVHLAGDGGFTSPPLQKGHTFSHTFGSPGTYAYICSIHPFMHGTVIVTG